MARYLEGLARTTGKPAYYSEVTRLFDLLPPFPNWRGHILRKLFALLDEEDARANRPFRTAMVIRKDRYGLPGAGFFYSLHSLKGAVHATKKGARRRLHNREKRDLIAFYRSIK